MTNASQPLADARPPATVTEAVLPGPVEPDGVILRQRPAPQPSRGQALVRVEASGVSFAEKAMRRGRYPGQPKFPFVPGYDLVGRVEAAGPGASSALVGRRVAALTKVGGWSTHAVVDVDDLVSVPDGVSPSAAETVVVNGITAWQMLHREAQVRSGQTILVHGANGGVGTVLCQLAVHAGVRVIGAASPRHHEALREMGVEAVDYADVDALSAEVRRLAPAGVDAVFDNVGGETLQHSWRLLAPGGTLVSYALAGLMQDPGSLVAHFVALLVRLAWWNLLPNGRHAVFYDIWSGHRTRPARFRRRLKEDLAAVFDLVANGHLTAQVAATFALTDIAAALTFAESGTVRGKVVILP